MHVQGSVIGINGSVTIYGNIVTVGSKYLPDSLVFYSHDLGISEIEVIE